MCNIIPTSPEMKIASIDGMSPAYGQALSVHDAGLQEGGMVMPGEIEKQVYRVHLREDRLYRGMQKSD